MAKRSTINRKFELAQIRIKHSRNFPAKSVKKNTCTHPKHPEGCQCGDNGAYAQKVELFWENSAE